MQRRKLEPIKKGRMVGNDWNKNTGVQVEHGVESTAGRLVDLLPQVGATNINEIARYSHQSIVASVADERTRGPTGPP